ncbi:hypothetical protein FDECE_4663 [Fusarium decemcellulare]|nr:hypothetical protein FDECE_4663 [Fusarium decemcellulare]
MHSQSLLFLTAPWATAVLADHLLGRYPPPTDLTSNQSAVAKSWKDLSSTLDATLAGSLESHGEAVGLKNITFSLGLFSLYDKGASKMQYHYTSPEIKNAENGTNEVDGDSIYQLASITKVFTVLTGLIECKNGELDRPLTDLLPGLADYVQQHPASEQPAHTIEWDKITPNTLAAHMAGLSHASYMWEDRLYAAAAPELARLINPTSEPLNLAEYGLPPLNLNDPEVVPPCFKDSFGGCDASEYMRVGQKRPPVFKPWTTPIYSNNGFAILGAALQNITGKTIDELYKSKIFDPLGMKSSSGIPVKADRDHAVMPLGISQSGFAMDLGFAAASGGICSSINDLAKFGTAILNSTLLPDDATRQWMKPVTHTDRLDYSIGRPWEIPRYTHPGSRAVTDLYTKSGSAGLFSTYIAFLPEYNAGFTLLSGSTDANRTLLAAILGDMVIDAVVPALEAQAAKEAGKNLEGYYVSNIEGLNSSLCLSQNETTGDINISSWISNGTDMMPIGEKTLSPKGGLRLVPSIRDSGSGQMAFVAEQDWAPDMKGDGPLAQLVRKRADWIYTDTFTYGGVGIESFVFEVDDKGRAQTVSPAITRAKLQRLK